jgi:acyl-CoA synthetase (AMP-forming)/AMP-acid ligase II
LTDAVPAPGEIRPSDAGGAGGREPAAILYTSGSTGLPKGIVLSHANLLAGTRIVANYLELTGRDRILSLLPFSFDYGLNQLLTAVDRGATLVLQRSHYPADICRSLASHGITGLGAVPPVWVQLMASTSPLPKMRLPELRYITNSGGTFPVELLRRYRAHLPHVRIYPMYGLTEAFRSTYLPPEFVDRLPDSIGKPIPESEILVVDQDGRRCGVGEVGELVHSGPTVALGYWRDPEATAARFRHHPFAAASSERVVYSGDLVRTDAQGFLYFVGRRDQLLKCFGQRVSPEEVEGIILASGLVDEAAVRGEPDAVAGTRVVAHVVPRRDAYTRPALLTWCRREMPAHMVPARIVEHDALPRTSTLKLDRQQVQA